MTMMVLRPGPGAKLGSSSTSGRLGMSTCIGAAPSSVNDTYTSTKSGYATLKLRIDYQ